jgi:hypothetical protein
VRKGRVRGILSCVGVVVLWARVFCEAFSISLSVVFGRPPRGLLVTVLVTLFGNNYEDADWCAG